MLLFVVSSESNKTLIEHDVGGSDRGPGIDGQ